VFYLELFKALQDDGVRYVVVGGLAVNLHGVSRLTMDVDLVVALDAENLSRFAKAAQRLALKPVVPVTLAELGDAAKVRSWIEEKHMLAFALRPPGRADPTIDLLMQPSVPFSEAYARRVEKDLGGIRVPIACVDDLIALKTGTGRLKDESDIAMLRALEAERSRGQLP
jgi:hypothetical protein